MNSDWAFVREPGVLWTALPGAVEAELERLKRIEFFNLESHSMRHLRLNVIGVLAHVRESGGTESLRVRLEYPRVFPAREPAVYDHDRQFQPSADGHQFADYGLCLRFPYRNEFTSDPACITREVLGAALHWLIKRNIYERSGRRIWPGQTEEHGYARPLRKLALERAASDGNRELASWTERTIDGLGTVGDDDLCPCRSGRLIRHCHSELAGLVRDAVHYRVAEGRDGRR